MSELEYEFDSGGRITSPGKFEGEMLYLPYFWNISLDGTCDILNNGVVSIPIEDQDVVHFAQLRDQERRPDRIMGLTQVVKILRGRKRRVRLRERDDGFVTEC